MAASLSRAPAQGRPRTFPDTGRRRPDLRRRGIDDLAVDLDAAEDPGAGAGRRLDPQLTADRRQAIPHPGDAGPPRRRLGGEAAAVVADLEAEVAVEAQLDPDAARAVGVLAGVLQRLQAAEVDGALDLRGQAGRPRRRSTVTGSDECWPAARSASPRPAEASSGG